MAADQGVILGVQNHHDVGVGVASYCEFLDEVDHPNCRAMFDPWAPALHGDDLKLWARRLAPRMVQTTLADYVRLPRYRYVPGLVNYEKLGDAVRAVPLGDGFLDLDGFFAGLREGGFDGYVAYEMCSPLRGGGGEAESRPGGRNQSGEDPAAHGPEPGCRLIARRRGNVSLSDSTGSGRCAVLILSLGPHPTT